MSDFFIFFISSAMIYFCTLVPLEYAFRKSKKTQMCIIGLVAVVFSIVNGRVILVNQNKIPVDAVEKEWDKYVIYCRQEHISWSDLTFPEWLDLDSEYDALYDEYYYE